MSARLPPVFLDSAAWIDVLEGGPLHAFVDAVARGHSGLGIAHTSDFVVLEAYSFIARNHRKAEAVRFLDLATGTGVYLHPCGADVVDDAIAQARSRPLGRELSLTDWTSAVLMGRHSVRHIVTTDRAFEQIGLVVIP